MKKYLAITEKRDQAKNLASAINLKQGRDCYTGKFRDGTITVVWASGHLLRLQVPDEIIPNLKWGDSPSKYIPIPRDYSNIVNDDGSGRVKGMLSTIRSYINQTDCLIISTDSDREGEAIGRKIVEHFNYRGEVKRAWLAAGLDKKSLQDAYNNLRGPYETIGMFRASEARDRTDRLFTFLTRAYTYYAQYGKFGSYLSQGRGSAGVMSVGRLQSVIVGMIVERDEEIKNFVAKDHYTLRADFDFKGASIDANYSPLVTQALIDSNPAGITWEPQKAQGDNIPLDKPLFTDKAAVKDFTNRLNSVKDQASISKSENKTEKENPPNTFELADAQAALSKGLGIDSGLAQTILEDLYEQGWTSYARTSKSELPVNLYAASERNSMFDAIIQLPSLNREAQLAKDIHNGQNKDYQPFMPKVFSKKDMEHYGISPTSQVMTPSNFAALKPRKADKGKVRHTPDQMRGAYEIICKQFICAMLPPATYTSQTIKISVPAQDMVGNPTSSFNAKAKKLVDAGWKSAFANKTGTDSIFPDLEKEDKGLLLSVKTKKQRTSPPKRYTKSQLPKVLSNVGKDVRDPELRKILRDAEGVGRPATRKSAIEKVIERNYVTLKGEVLHSSERGQELIKYIPKWLKSPETSARMEDYMNKISSSKDDNTAIEMRDMFENMQTEKVEKLIQYMIDKFDSNLGERVKAAPKEVSAKMKKFIKTIAQQKGLEIPRGTLSNPVAATAFINEHYEKRPEGQSYPPSDKQIALAKRIVSSLPDGFEVDEAIYQDSKKMSAFIDKNKKNIPPSEAQLKLVRSLKAKLEANALVPEGIETSASAASAFIDEQMSKNKTKKTKKS